MTATVDDGAEAPTVAEGASIERAEAAEAIDVPARPRRGPDPTLVRLCVAVVLPILASTVMLLIAGWGPVGDNATLSIRAGDVLRGDPPLTGMPTTADTITGTKLLDHPGPIEVWSAAIPYRLLGPVGLLLTVAAVNAAALVLAVVVGWRRGRAALATAVTATGLLLCWSLGTTVIRDPLNSHVSLIPMFALVLLAWDVRAGRWRTLPVAVATASWVAQAHVAYALPVATTFLGTAALMVLDHRRRSPEARRRAARGRRHGVVWGVTVGLLLNLPLLIDQATGSGNLGRMLGFGDQPGQGLGTGARVLVTSFGFPPAWLRPVNDPFVLLRAPTVVDLLAFGATVGLVVWTTVDAHRRRDRTASTLLHAALLAVLGALLVVVRTPKGGAVLAADPMLLWRPVTAAVWLAVGWGTWRAVTARHPGWSIAPVARRALGITGGLLALALVAVTVFAPAKFGGYGEELMAPADTIATKASGAVADERLVQVNASGWAARLYLRHSIVERLERDGIATRTADPERAFRREGAGRGAPSATVWVVSDPVEPRAPAPGAVLVARTDLRAGGPYSQAAERRRKLRAAIDDAGEVQLRDGGRISLEDISREYFRWTTPPPSGDRTLPAEWVSTDAFVDLARNGLIASPTIDRALVDAVYRDAIGRFFATEDTEVAIYVRREG